MAVPLDRDFVWLRWALTLALAYLILLGEPGSPSAKELLYVALLLSSNVLLGHARQPPDARAVLVVDTLFVWSGLLVHAGATQDLLVAYFLCIVMAALAETEHALAGAACLVAAAYAGWALQAGLAHASWLRLPFLFVTTVFYGYMMQRVRVERGARRQAEATARGLEALLHVTRSFSSALATESILGRVADTLREALDAGACRIRPIDDDEALEAEVAEALARRETVRGRVLALPILYENEILGALLVEREAPPFTDDEVALCEIVAHAAAPALYRARRYEMLAEAERRKTAFLIRLSHELRTPLTTIRLCTDLAVDSAAHEECSPILRESLGRIERSLGDLQKQIDELTRAAREHLDTELVRLERIDLRELVEECVRSAASPHADTASGCEVEIEAGPEEIYADRSRIGRILEPLLWSLARDPDAPRLRISAALDAGASSTRPGRPWERLLSVSIRNPAPEPGDAGENKSRLALRRDAALAASLELSRRLARAVRGSIEHERIVGDGSLLRLRMPVEVRQRS